MIREKSVFGRITMAGIFISVILLLSACSGSSSIVGQWSNTDSKGTITFSTDGSFSEGNYNFHGTVLGQEYSYQSYSLSGGNLTFKGTLADTVILKESSSKDCAYGEYYLNGDTLVIDGVTFDRVK